MKVMLWRSGRPQPALYLWSVKPQQTHPVLDHPFFGWRVYFHIMHWTNLLMRAGNLVKFFKTYFARFLKLHPMKKTTFLMILLELELWSYISDGCSELYLSSCIQTMRQIALF